MPRLPQHWRSAAWLMAIGWPATVIALGLSITQQVWFFRTPLAQPMGTGFTWLLVFELLFAAAGMLCTSATLLGSKQHRADYEGAYFPWGAVLPLAGIIFLLVGPFGSPMGTTRTCSAFGTVRVAASTPPTWPCTRSAG